MPVIFWTVSTVRTLILWQFNAVNVFKYAQGIGEPLKEGKAGPTWIPAPPNSPLPAIVNTVGENMTPVETATNTTKAAGTRSPGGET